MVCLELIALDVIGTLTLMLWQRWAKILEEKKKRHTYTHSHKEKLAVLHADLTVCHSRSESIFTGCSY